MLRSQVLPPFPAGWYAVSPSRDLKLGVVVTRTFFGREIVVYRTESGAVCAVEAWCPHLGAHLGKGGRVEGEQIRCPFHGFRFDQSGTCTKAYDGHKGTIKAGLQTFPVLDRNGWILLWGDLEGGPPWFEPDVLDTDDWTPLDVHKWKVRSHPQETTENSVDTGHFSVVHGYTNVATIEPMTSSGAYLTATYHMERDNPFGRLLPQIRTNFKVHVWGLGYSQVDLSVENYGFEMRLFVLPQPTDGTHIDLRVAMSTKNLSATYDGLPSALPTGWLTGLLNRHAGAEAANDVTDDFDVWNHKVYIAPPALARGDGPIGHYRRYCQQFYPAEAPALQSSSAR